jgi:cysteine desulfurase/selenocysteine lyase
MRLRRLPIANLASGTARPEGFAWLEPRDVYLDAACQSLRPQPVIDAVTAYYTTFGACGGRVRYAWGHRVDEEVGGARDAVLDLLDLSGRRYAVSFTLNTSYGLNLLLSQLPAGSFARVVTSHLEHNSVFLPTITAARRLGVERLVLEREADGSLGYSPPQLDRAVVVVNVVSNVDGRRLLNLEALVRDTHERGGIVVLDAAQAVPHALDLVRHTAADAICWSGHKAYAPSLGVVVARHELLERLDLGFIGGGMVADVHERDYELLPDEPAARLEPGLQAWAEIVGLRAALGWLAGWRFGGRTPDEHMHELGERLYQGLADVPGVRLLNSRPGPIVSLYAPEQDAHRLAVFLSRQRIMVRSGYFCVHHGLKEHLGLPPLLRFSVGLHTTPADVDAAVHALGRLMQGLG